MATKKRLIRRLRKKQEKRFKKELRQYVAEAHGLSLDEVTVKEAGGGKYDVVIQPKVAVERLTMDIVLV
jgi:hypothetical protein